MAYRIPLGRVHQITSSGTPLSGAKLYVFDNLTSAPTALFTNYDGTGTAANPIVADSAGRFPIRYVSSSDRLTLVLKTSAGVTIWSDDNVAPELADIAGVLLAANNLSDVASGRASLDALFSKGSDVVAATTTNLSNTTGDFIDITGAATIDAFTLSAGDRRLVRFTGAGTITYNASSLIIPGAANWTRASGDVALVVGIATGVFLLPWPISGGVLLSSAVKPPECLFGGVAMSDETTSITAGAAKVTAHVPYDFTITEVFAGLTGASSSGQVQIDVNKNSVSIFSTTVTIEEGENTSLTAGTPPVLSTTSLAKGDTLTFDLDADGTSAEGLKCYIVGRRT